MPEIFYAIITATSALASAGLHYAGAVERAKATRALASSINSAGNDDTDIDSANRTNEPASSNAHTNPPDYSAVVVHIVYPGSERFKTSSITKYTGTESEQDIDVNISPVELFVDGVAIGRGDGYRGFSTECHISVGRHSLSAVWTGDKTRYRKNRGTDTEKDLGGRESSVIHLRSAQTCTVHLDEKFTVEHCEPPVAVAGCVYCRSIAKLRCRCGAAYCKEHASILDGSQACLKCANKRKMLYIRAGQICTAFIAVISFIAWISK